MADVDTARNSWQGASYDDVVARWGAPTREATLSNNRVARTWVAETAGGGGVPGTVGVYGGSYGGGGVGIQLGLPGSGGYGGPKRCERTLVFGAGNTIVEQSWLGDPGLCSAFKRQ